MPSSEELVKELASLYKRFGYEVIFLGSLLEALILVNFFIPGAAAVAFGAVFARSGEVDLALAVIFASLGAIIGFLIDFLLGYFGFGQIFKKLGYGQLLERAKEKIQSSYSAFSLGFIHPNLGSLVSLAAGTIKMRFLSFLGISALSTVAFFCLWGILFFAAGEVLLILLTRYFFVIMLLILSFWILTIIYGKSKVKV